jgi:DNA-binding NarL/FixJ family response regulator
VTTVLIVDDHPLVRAGLRGIIEAAGDLTVVGEAADGRDLVPVVRDLDPDVVLMDLSMPHVDGNAPIDPRVARALLPSAARPDAVAGLSAREREVLALVAKGMANKQVARALGISERTVKVHLGNVFRHIGVADRTSAALWARDHGFG